MLRFFVVAFIVAAPFTVAAQMVLVQRPPIYQHGEFARGVLVDQVGAQLELQQRAEYGPDQKVYVRMSMMDRRGTVLGHIVFDPSTWRTQSVSESEIGKTLTSTCSPDTLYPITLRKVYECTSTIQVNDRVLNSRLRMEFDSVEHNTQGRLIAFCATSEDNNDEIKNTFRICFSPDGKWVRLIRILNIVPNRKT